MADGQRFRQVLDPSDNPELTAVYEEILQSGFGQDAPVNWFTSQGERPDLLSANWEYAKKVVMQGVLPATVKQMIVVMISSHNNCRYCRVTHTQALSAMGVPEEVIDCLTTDLNLSKVPPPQRTILAFALKVAREPDSVSDDDFVRLRDQGLNNGEIMEAAMMAAYTNFINSWALVSGIPIDGEEDP